MTKPFEDLTIADDFMFCKVMQDEAICKEFLEMVLAGKIGKIACVSSTRSEKASPFTRLKTSALRTRKRPYKTAQKRL